MKVKATTKNPYRVSVPFVEPFGPIPMEDGKVHFWREAGEWRCAVPRDDLATQNGFDWKHFGLVGRGITQNAALEDLQSWQRASDFVASIY